MDYIWVLVAFAFGFLAKQINIPPLVGYLIAGFGLHALGIKFNPSLEALADIGISLLLFTIGLKLNIKTLFKTEIWAGALGHMFIIIVITSLNSFLLAYIGYVHFNGLGWQSAIIIGFAVSFSSTVCAIKVLEDRGEMRSRHAQVAIGILVIQDIAAVLFVTFASETTPSLWALSLLTLPLFRPLLHKLLQHSGHGEILALAGFFLTFTGGALFESVGLKSHLGALVFGVLLSNHTKTVELAKSLLSFKELFLIGFFLSIGFTALPTIDMLKVAFLMALALPIKAGLFFLWLTYLKLRSRTAFLSALSLANFSEFGLIVCSVSVSYGLLPKEWLVIMAVSVALSFVFSSIVNIKAHELHRRWKELFKRFEQSEYLVEDQFSSPYNASVLVIGMGRVGTGAYDTLSGELQKKVCGIELDKTRAASQCKIGRNVIMADAEDPDFWEHIDLTQIHLIMFALPNHSDVLEVSKQLFLAGYQGKTAGIARYIDEEKKLLSAGIDVVFNYYTEVGSGFAEQTIHYFDSNQIDISKKR